MIVINKQIFFFIVTLCFFHVPTKEQEMMECDQQRLCLRTSINASLGNNWDLVQQSGYCGI